MRIQNLREEEKMFKIRNIERFVEQKEKEEEEEKKEEEKLPSTCDTPVVT